MGGDGGSSCKLMVSRKNKDTIMVVLFHVLLSCSSDPFLLRECHCRKGSFTVGHRTGQSLPDTATDAAAAADYDDDVG